VEDLGEREEDGRNEFAYGQGTNADRSGTRGKGRVGGEKKVRPHRPERRR
jgi:hypothetical protein